MGQAYVAQSTDVMNSIQRLRGMALAQGNLVSTQQQQVTAVGGVIQIVSARTGYMFLPSYDPELVFAAPAFVSFGPALAVDSSWTVKSTGTIITFTIGTTTSPGPGCVAASGSVSSVDRVGIGSAAGEASTLAVTATA